MMFSTLSHKTYHSFAIQLKEIMPDSVVGISSGANVAIDYIKNQNVKKGTAASWKLII